MLSFHLPDISTLIALIVMWISIGNMIRLDIKYRRQRHQLRRRRLKLMESLTRVDKQPLH